MSTKPKDNPERGTNWRERIVVAPRTWLLLLGVVTIGWLLAIMWGAIYVAFWLFS